MSEKKVMQGPFGLKMSDQEASDYLQGLAGSKDPGIEGLEAECFRSWRQTVEESERASQRLGQARAQVAALERAVQALSGKARGFVELLIAAEEGRRNQSRRERGELEIVPGERPAK